MTELEISIRFASQASMIMEDIIRYFESEGIDIIKTSTTTYQWEENEINEEEVSEIVYEIDCAFIKAGIPDEEYWFYSF